MARPAIWLLLALPAAPAQDLFRPLTLSGRVVLEDGTPPPEPAVIELRCEGERQPQYYTDRRGYFSFRVGGERSRSVPDSQRARLGQPVGAGGPDRSFVSLTNCELEASLAGFTSSKVYLGRRSVFENTDVGTIVLKRIVAGEGHFISMNTLAAPAKAREAYEKALACLRKERPEPDRASRELEKAVSLYPAFAAAWNRLGELRARAGDRAGARAAFQRAAEADPKFVPPLLALALAALEGQEAVEAARRANQALQLAPGLAEAHYYHALAQYALGNEALAEASARAALSTPEAARYPRLHFLLGNMLAARGDLAGAAAELRRFVELEPGSRAAEAARQQLREWGSEGRIP
ncbi:MAG TPA: tetratricopeptide repeat protein [Bryobacteraceae bacterium]|nr:tetratricopeptide repeat protein [Bryobacteraceae bacterium]